MKEILGIKLYNTEETAKMLGVTELTVRNYFNSGKMMGQKIGGALYFSEQNIKGFLHGDPLIQFTDEERKKLYAIGTTLFGE